MNLEELLHVYDSHTGNGLRFIEGEEVEYSRYELIKIIKDSRDEIKLFKENWLIPAIKELEKLRVVTDT